MTRTRATLIGFGAVLLWAALAFLTLRSAPVPPFQLNAMTFAIGGAAGLVWALASGGRAAFKGIGPGAVLFGTAGLFGYHAVYFTAIRWGDAAGSAAETGLIAYLWPLLIVLGSGLLPGERLRRAHLLGAALAFGGAALIVTAGGEGFRAEALPGYALGLLCAAIWAIYSVGSRRLGEVPTAAVALFCLLTAALSVPVHLATETTVWPASPVAWLAIAGLGLGPVGLAFFLWDIGMKRGDIQLLGTASYAAPLLSTLVLILAGDAQPTGTLALSAALIGGGAAIAARAGQRGVSASSDA